MKRIYGKIAILIVSSTVALLLLLIGNHVFHMLSDHAYYLEDLLQDVQKNIAREIYEAGNDQAIERVLNQSPTDYQTTIASIDKGDGTLIAMTENNQTDVYIDAILSDEQRLRYLQERADQGWEIIHANETKYMMQVMTYENAYLIALRDIGVLIEKTWQQTLVTICFACLICLVVIATLYRLLENNLFYDLRKVNQQMQRILQGHYVVDCPTCRLKELEQTIEAIRALMHGYRHKDERLNTLFGSISPHLAAFECLPQGGGNFYSSSLWELLHIQEEDRAYFQSHPKDFQHFLRDLNQQKRADGMVLYQGNHLEIFLHELYGEMVGVIIDRTKEEKAKKRLELSLENEKQKRTLDDLTRVLNRKSFQEAIERSLLLKEKGTLLLFDLDHFKDINDALGHPQGDRVLCLFASRLKELFRQSDQIGRLGGDEFVVFLPDHFTDDALEAKLTYTLEQIQKTFLPYASYALSVSIGVSQIASDTGITSYEMLYEAADSALYIAKRLGKNRFYINAKGIRCMVSVCQYCRKECARREVLGLGK